MRVSVQTPENVTDDYLRWLSAIGVDCIDIGSWMALAGVKEKGHPDLEELLRLKRRVNSHGLEINRTTLPSVNKFMLGAKGGEEEVEHVCKTIRVLGEARIPIARPAFATSSSVWPEAHKEPAFRPKHRGNYTMRGFDLRLRAKQSPRKPDPEETLLSLSEQWWSRVEEFYSAIMPLAEEHGVKIAMHPSDAPLPDTPFNGLGLHRLIDIYPSRNNGLLYCVGTRYEEGGTQLVLDEINHYGRKGKIFLVHFRNVRGSLATSEAFEEVLLDDGDMNMFRILLALDKVGYEGCLNPDHMPSWDGDSSEKRQAWSYSVGYIKGMLAALAALP